MFEVWCLVFLLLVACTARSTANCSCEPVGVGNRKLIKDSQMTSSGVLYDHLKAAHARFNNAYAWCPKQNRCGMCDCPQNCSYNPLPCHGADPFGKTSHMCEALSNCTLPARCDKPTYRDWLQVDMGRTRHVCGVATQGRDGVRDWAAYYKVKLSRDGKKWLVYKEHGKRKVFKGNADTNSIVKHFFRSPMSARYVRFYPQKRKKKLHCMKIEVFVEKDPAPLALPNIYRNAWVGGRLWLPCLAQGNPAPLVSWLKDGKPPTSGHVQHKIIVLGDLTSVSLVISHVTYKDQGVYSCLIKDYRCPEIIKKEKKYDVSVYIHPKDVLVLAGGSRSAHVRQDVQMGGKLMLHCTAWYGEAKILTSFEERHAPFVIWHKDGKPVTHRRARKKATVNRNEISASLVISPVTCHEDGQYSCVVRNYRFPNDYVRKTFRVHILKHGLVMLGPRRVRQNVLTGGRLRLQCIAYGDPAPNVTWLKDRKPVIDSRARNRTVVSGGNTSASLVISPVTCQDAGVYMCLMKDYQRCPDIKEEKKFSIRVFKRNVGVSCKKRPKQK